MLFSKHRNRRTLFLFREICRFSVTLNRNCSFSDHRKTFRARLTKQSAQFRSLLLYYIQSSQKNQVMFLFSSHEIKNLQSCCGKSQYISIAKRFFFFIPYLFAFLIHIPSFFSPYFQEFFMRNPIFSYSPSHFMQFQHIRSPYFSRFLH